MVVVVAVEGDAEAETLDKLLPVVVVGVEASMLLLLPIMLPPALAEAEAAGE